MNNIKIGLLASTVNNHLLKLNLESIITHFLGKQKEQTKSCSHTDHWKYPTARFTIQPSFCFLPRGFLWCQCAYCSAAVHPGGTKLCSRLQGKQSSRVHLPAVKNTGSEAHYNFNNDGCCWAIYMIWDILELTGKLSKAFEFSLVVRTSLSPGGLQGWV